jgi:hypothetical protein
VSFLDNLENSLKSLDTQDERAADRGSQKEKRDAERAQALAIAPWAEQLKPSPGLGHNRDHGCPIARLNSPNSMFIVQPDISSLWR